MQKALGWVAAAVAIMVAITVFVLLRHSKPAVVTTSTSATSADDAAAPEPVQVAPLRPRAQPTNLAHSAVAPAARSSSAAGIKKPAWLERIEKGGIHFTPEQLANYFRQNGTNASTLLTAAYLGTNRSQYVKLAASLYPNDPRVQFALLGLGQKEMPAGERREWLNKFKDSAPDNALASYLSAREYMQSGDRSRAMQDLAAAIAQPHFNDYTLEQGQALEQAQLEAGVDVVEAKAGSSASLLLPHLAMLKELSTGMQTMEKESIAAGDSRSAEALAQMGSTLAHQLIDGEGSRCLINQFVGVAIERMMLSQLPPDGQPAFLGKSVQDRLDELTTFRDTTKAMSGQWEEMIARGDSTEIIAYFDRLKAEGEFSAMQWLAQRGGNR